MTQLKQGRKVKKSYSISPESERFIREVCRERNAKSESETLDALLGELMAAQQQRSIEVAYSEYYDSLTEEEISEQHAWGAFAETQLLNGTR